MMEKKNKKRLGDVLVQQGSLTEHDLNRAVAMQNEKVMRLGEILLQDGFVSKAEIGKAMEQVQEIAYAECPPASIAPQILTLVPQSLAVKCCALPLKIEGRELVIAMAEPQNLAFIDDLRFKAGMQISPRFSFRGDIIRGIRKFYCITDFADLQSCLPLVSIVAIPTKESQAMTSNSLNTK
jgi:type IV pilus assembly protein PilB